MLAMAFASSVVVGCHDTPTTPLSPTPQVRKTLSKPVFVGAFVLRDLGTLGGNGGAAYDINESGTVVGISSDTNYVQKPVVWPADGLGPLDLGSINGEIIGPSADAINTAGDIAGVADIGTAQGPTLWPAGGGPARSLGSLPGLESFIWAMNDAGEVVGESDPPEGIPAHATYWPAGGPPRELATLGYESVARAINSSGTIVGWSNLNNGGNVSSIATLWPVGGGAPQALRPPPGITSCSAWAINDKGDVAGSCDASATAPGGLVLWPGDGSPARYVDTTGGWPQGINSAGDIVGSANVGPTEHAAFWPADGSGRQDLGALPFPNRWSRAVAINSARKIVGYTVDINGTSHPVSWEPAPQQPQSITFTSAPPNPGIVGGTYTVSATGGGSGNPVTIGSLTSNVCSVSGNVVSLRAGGTCTIAANQAGSPVFFPAPQVTQSFAVNTRPVANAGAAQSGNEGSAITFSATNSSDPDGDALTSFTWDFGDGTVLTASSPTVTHIYGDNKAGGGAYAVSLQVTDARGATSPAATTSALIANVPPTATFAPASPIGEGIGSLSLSGVLDAPGDLTTLQYAFDCGDGNGYSAYGSSPSLACIDTDNGVRSVRAKVRDKDGAESEYSGTIVVTNVAPAITITSAPSSGKTGSDYALVFSFTDPGTGDMPWRYTVNWGDGRRVDAPQSVTTQGLLITEKNRYNKPGTYSITVSVSDKDGGNSTSTVQVVILK